jgi:hypothetical protein
MLIRFDFGQSSYSRHFDSVMEALRRRGHIVETSAFWNNEAYPLRPIAGADHRHILVKKAKSREGSLGFLGYILRCARDHLLYRRPGFSPDSLVARRITNHLKIGLEGEDNELGMGLADFIAGLSDEQCLAFDRLLSRFEGLLPHDPVLERVLEAPTEAPAELPTKRRGILGLFSGPTPSAVRAPAPKTGRPDLLCITPLVVTQFGQAELVKAAKARGIPVVFLANSWDNLTTKGTIHVQPDWTIVWNGVQAREAVELHGIPQSTILVTGAPRFDGFFARKAAQTRDEFLRSRGLDPSRPAITYLGSSNLISANETDFVRRWIRAIRGSGQPILAEANILLRPHPKFREGWEELPEEGDRIALCASEVLNNDELLYHTLCHCQVVVGANTSAELEAAILHRPILTIHDPQFSTGQEETVHFRYLLREHGGVVQEAMGIPEHIGQLVAVLSAEEVPERNRAFLESFLRPGGLDRPAAEVTADAICRILERSGR